MNTKQINEIIKCMKNTFYNLKLENRHHVLSKCKLLNKSVTGKIYIDLDKIINNIDYDKFWNLHNEIQEKHLDELEEKEVQNG